MFLKKCINTHTYTNAQSTETAKNEKKIQIPPIYIEAEKESSKHSTPRPLPLQTGLPVKFKVEEWRVQLHFSVLTGQLLGL